MPSLRAAISSGLLVTDFSMPVRGGFDPAAVEHIENNASAT